MCTLCSLCQTDAVTRPHPVSFHCNLFFFLAPEILQMRGLKIIVAQLRHLAFTMTTDLHRTSVKDVHQSLPGFHLINKKPPSTSKTPNVPKVTGSGAPYRPNMLPYFLVGPCSSGRPHDEQFTQRWQGATASYTLTHTHTHTAKYIDWFSSRQIQTK